MTDPAFVCPRCGAESWNPNDAKYGYCGRCHWWTGDPILGKLEPPDAPTIEEPLIRRLRRRLSTRSS